MKVGDEYDIVVSSGIARCSGPQYNSRKVIPVTVEKVEDGIATMSNGERWYIDTKRLVPNGAQLSGTTAAPLHQKGEGGASVA